MKKDEISSTEKLLEQIRGNRSDSSSTSPPPPEKFAAAPLGVSQRLRSALKFTSPVRIGVDIGYADVRLIKTIQSGRIYRGHSGRFRLIEHWTWSRAAKSDFSCLLTGSCHIKHEYPPETL